MKKLTKLFATIFSVMLLMGTFIPAYAEEDVLIVDGADKETTLTVTSGVDKTAQVPLTLKSSAKTFYLLNNVNPGDTMKTNIVFDNKTGKEQQVSISEIVNKLTGDKHSDIFLKELVMTITSNGKPIFKGKASEITKPATPWITVKEGEQVKFEIKIEFPKEADNTFQAAPMHLQVVFMTRGDVPADPTPTPTTTPRPKEKTNTGDVSVAMSYAPYILGTGIVIVLIYVVSNKKKKKEEN